jgi:hypothetical protein
VVEPKRSRKREGKGSTLSPGKRRESPDAPGSEGGTSDPSAPSESVSSVTVAATPEAGAESTKGGQEPPAIHRPFVPPPTKESFDQLHRKAAAAQPRRGSITQPPPAWQPEEVTLGFAMVAGDDGALQELPEPTLLATILVAVEADRHRIVNRLAGGADEEIEAVASVFWPLIVLPGRQEPEVAIFDGTGVWTRAFRYTILPGMDNVTALLAGEIAPTEFLDRMRRAMPHFAQDMGTEVLNVEGFLPIDPPLLFDVLSHSDVRSDPQTPHAGFLPSRREMSWYQDTVGQMFRWLDRFDGDLQTLRGVRDQFQTRISEMEHRLDAEYARLQGEALERTQQAAAQSEQEIAAIQSQYRARIQPHVATLRKTQAVVVHSETSAATADTLSFRATHRRTAGEAHHTRKKQAESAIRQANLEAAEARKEIEQLHAAERADTERAIVNAGQVEQKYAKALADHELFRDEFSAAGVELLHAVDGQIAARSAQKNLLAGYFLPVPNLANVKVVWFPLWLATLRGSRGIRQLVFPPMQVLEQKGWGSALKQALGGVVLPVEPRTAQFDKVLRTTMEDALRRDAWLSTATQELTRAADVLVDPDVLHRLQQGLRDLGRQGWITPKQEKSFLAVYVGRAQRKAGQPEGSTAPVPVGASSDRFTPPRPSGASPPPPPPP